MHQKQPINHDEIAVLAATLWDQAGRPVGRDLEFWLSAEQRLASAPSAKADTTGSAQARPEALVSPSTTTPEPTGFVRFPPAQTNSPEEKNGGNSATKAPGNGGQSRAKRAASNLTPASR